MKLASILAPFTDLYYAIAWAFRPVLDDIRVNPIILLKPWSWSRFFFSKVWIKFGDGVDEGGRAVKTDLLLGARGVVLDIGAGHGHALAYLDKSRVTTYIALEPNILMHVRIRERASNLGYMEEPESPSDKGLIILGQGAEDVAGIAVTLLSHNIRQVDTILSILTFCSIPTPEKSLPAFITAFLKPGGTLLYYEHVRSHRADVARWQRVWSPVWSKCFDGCRLDVPTDKLIEGLTNKEGHEFWAEKKVWGKEGESEENLFWHRVGRYTRS